MTTRTRKTTSRGPVAQVKSTRVGPWRSVRTTNDPMDDPPDILVDATNLYIPDPQGASGAYALPGLPLENNGNPITTSATAFRGQGAFSHTDLDNVSYNFAVWNGKLFRVSADRTTYTDVTPTTIDAGITTRVYGTSFVGSLVISDGVNRPWVATNLASTPITATPIDFDGAGTAWAAWGPGREYAGCLIFVLVSVGGVPCRMDIAWSLPADPFTGWQQPDYDFRWTLEQSGTGPIYGTFAENTQFYYWRENSIGSLSGVPGPSFQGQATHDAISKNIGTLSPQSIIAFGDNIFFADQVGRPYMLEQGSRDLKPLWLEMRAIVDASTYGFPATTQIVLTAALEPNLNLWIIAPWSPFPAQDCPAVEGYIFDARTGAYFGRFMVADGVQIDTLGVFTDSTGRGVMVVQGSKVPPVDGNPADSGYFWSMNSIAGIGEFLTTEDGVFLTTENGVLLMTEGSVINWEDNGQPKQVRAVTSRIGYAPETVISVDSLIALVGNTDPVQVSAQTASVAQTVEGTPVPSTVQDSISKLTCGFDGIQGRGVQAALSPTETTTQWSLQTITLRYVESVAGVDDV